MANTRRKFEILYPTIDTLVREPAVPANADLIQPQATALIQGEMVQTNATGQYIRATDALKPSYHVFSDAGDTGLQASGKIDAITVGSYVCNTIAFLAAGLVDGAPLKMVTGLDLNDGQGAIRTGVGFFNTGSEAAGTIIVGYVRKLPANNGGTLLQMVRVGL